MDKKGNIYGIFLVAGLFVAVAALLTSNPSTTGMVIQEITANGKPVVVSDTKESCFGNVQHGSCLETKPLFCDNGNFEYNCFACGCNPGESCTGFGTCEILEQCADGSFYNECSFLRGKFCDNGALTDNCELCGCDESETCSDGKCIPP